MKKTVCPYCRKNVVTDDKVAHIGACAGSPESQVARIAADVIAQSGRNILAALGIGFLSLAKDRPELAGQSGEILTMITRALAEQVSPGVDAEPIARIAEWTVKATAHERETALRTVAAIL